MYEVEMQRCVTKNLLRVAAGKKKVKKDVKLRKKRAEVLKARLENNEMQNSLESCSFLPQGLKASTLQYFT